MAQVQTEAAWPQAQAAAGTAAPDWVDAAGADLAERLAANFSRLGLILCFLSAVLTLAGIGSALERIFS